MAARKTPCLAREIRALGVYSEIHPHDITLEEVKALPNVKGIILNGGPNRVVDGVEIDAAKEIYNHDVPVLLADHKGDQPWPSDEEERKQALSNFVFGVCGAQPNWNMENFIADQVELIRQPGGRPEGPAGPVRRRGLLRGGCPADSRPSANSSPASTSTTGCCARASQNRWWRCSAIRWTPT